jgi:SAM-dependent methyltransferase
MTRVANHAPWQPEHVVDVRDAAFAARTYLEQRAVRDLLAAALGGARVRAAAEVGAGYGRMTPVLTEFANRVVGFEREPHFVADASRLWPAITFTQVASLESLPVESSSFDLVLTFTVLQHLIDPVARRAAAEMTRVLAPRGHLLICEETDPAHTDGATTDPAGRCTIGRPVTVYQELFASLDLLTTRPREIEPTYPRPDVGTYMLFRKGA